MKFPSIKKALSTPWQRTLYIMFFAQLMTAVGFSSIFPFLPLYVKELGSTTNSSIELLAGLVFSAQAITMMIASPIWGSLADRYGRKLMVVRSLFGGAILLLLMAFVRSAEELILLRAIQGFITGTLAATNALVAAAVPRDRTGYAMGLLQVGLGTGIALGPLIGGAVADAYGYGPAFYITAALLLLAGFIVLFGVREEFVPSEERRAGGVNFVTEWRQMLTAPGVSITYGIRFLSQLGRMMLIPMIPLFVQRLLSDESGLNTFTGLVIGVGSATTTLSAIYLGRLGDRIGHRKIVIISIFVAALLYFPQGLVSEGWQLLFLFALVGVAMGGIIPGVSALLSSFTSPGMEGAVYGLDNSIRAAARSVAPLIGSGVAIWFGLRGTFAATGFVFVLAGLLALWRLPQPELTVEAPLAETQTRHW
jgi:DHA1 family multidrug resistance protein-like MFS transporter